MHRIVPIHLLEGSEIVRFEVRRWREGCRRRLHLFKCHRKQRSNRWWRHWRTPPPCPDHPHRDHRVVEDREALEQVPRQDRELCPEQERNEFY